VLLLVTLVLYAAFSRVAGPESLSWSSDLAGRPLQKPTDRVQGAVLWIVTTLVLSYLVLPIVAIIPLSFNAGGFLLYPLTGLSLRWYETLFTSPDWTNAIENSLIVGSVTTVVATALGTLAALGLTHARFPLRSLVMGIVISPMIIPVVVLAVGFYFFFAPLHLTQSYLGLILAHTTLATPLVVITVSAALAGFDRTLLRAASMLGANPVRTFLKVVLPLVLPGVIAGALFALSTSLDEIVTVIFLAGPDQMTLPLQMLTSVNEYITPTITAVATILIATSVLLLTVIELLRRRGERLRGVRV
jgi:putative spermidine/putrescine transport system permease protein